MITHIRMKNFKSWKDSGEVELAPLTGFFGTNSSGKSSLLQMLLLLKQTAEQEDAEEVIFWGDENSRVNLGDFREVIHGHRLGEHLEFELACQLTHSSSNYNIPREQTVNRFAFDSEIRSEQGKSIVERLSYCRSYKEREVIIYHQGSVFFPSSRPNRDPERDQHKINLSTCYGKTSSTGVTSGSIGRLREFSAAFEELFSHVHYLGPVRIQPQRHYHWEGAHPKEIDQWGGRAIETVLSAGIRKLKSSNKENAALIEDRISEWLQRMELAHSFRLIPTSSLDDQNYEVRIQKSLSSVEVTLADMGYGLADVLPMLIYCYYVEEGSMLILEQPGVHLHPKVQSELADFFIEVVNERKLQILVESHSEHLLNRLQRRIAEEKISVDQTALYFCRNDEGVSSKERLITDKFGNISNWPENFFGDEMSELFARSKAEMERRKRAEGE